MTSRTRRSTKQLNAEAIFAVVGDEDEADVTRDDQGSCDFLDVRFRDVRTEEEARVEHLLLLKVTSFGLMREQNLTTHVHYVCVHVRLRCHLSVHST